MFLCFDDVINMTSKAQFLAIFQIFGFVTQIRKNYAIFVTCTKNETVCETGSTFKICWMELTKLAILLIFQILRRHNDFVLKNWFEIWNHGIKISLSGEFQFIILSIDWDNEIWSRKKENLMIMSYWLNLSVCCRG